MQMGAGDVDPNAPQLPHGDLGISSIGKPVQIEFIVPESSFPVDISTLARIIQNRPKFNYSDGGVQKSIPFDFAGFSKTSISETVQFGLDSSIDLSMLGLDESITIYAMWKPTKYVLKFSGGNDISVTGSMANQEVLPDKTFTINECQFHCSEKVKMFDYHNPPAGAGWIKGESPTATQMDKYGFSHWEYSGGNGRVYTAGNKQTAVISGSGSIQTPIVEFTAKWVQRYGTVTFLVDDQPYCDVMLDLNVNQLVYPDVNPTFPNSNRIFLGWSLPEGTYLQGIDDDTPIVCEDGQTPILCSSDSEGSIVCVNNYTPDYGIQVTAFVGENTASQYRVQFRYMDTSGTYRVAKEDVVENQTLVPFHIHQKVVKADGEYVFRYWKLVSGNINSSLTIMSDCVFDAVYDKVAQFPNGKVDKVPEVLEITPVVDLRPPDVDVTCVHFNGTCTFYGQDPKKYNWDHTPDVCPYLKMMEKVW